MSEPTFRPDPRAQPAPCGTSCPGGTDVRGWIAIIAQRGKLGLGREEAYRAAWRKIVDVNPFPAVMGRICPHPCEAGCNRAAKDGAVSVHELERFLGDWALEQRLPLPTLDAEPKPERVAVIGAGPAGLSFVYQMARRGYPVTVYESRPHAGGMLRYGIPVYRLPRHVLDAEIDRVLALGVDLRLGVRVGSDVALDELEARHPVLFLGIGAHRGVRLGVPGEEGPGAWTGNAYLAAVHRGEHVALGRRVAVVGGGNSALDAARVARRAGSDVTLLYRRTREEMPASDGEIEEALLEGVRIRYLVAPMRIGRRDGRVVSIEVRRMELGAPDESGRKRPVPVEGSETEIPVDAVITAVHREADWDRLEPLRDRLDGNSGDGFVRAAGDVLGLGIASRAIAQGRIAAESVHARLRGERPPESAAAEPLDLGAAKLDYYEPKPRIVPGRRPPEDWLRNPDEEIHTGITPEQFEEEVARCLSCGQCFGCRACWMFCAHRCFDPVDEPQPGAYFTVSSDRCQACGKCIDVCPCAFLQVRDSSGSRGT